MIARSEGSVKGDGKRIHRNGYKSVCGELRCWFSLSRDARRVEREDGEVAGGEYGMSG